MKIIFYFILGLLLLSLILEFILNIRNAIKLYKAREKYKERQQCNHIFFKVTHKEVDFVMIMSDKWCKVCGKYLGIAKRKKCKWWIRWWNKWEWE